MKNIFKNCVNTRHKAMMIPIILLACGIFIFQTWVSTVNQTEKSALRMTEAAQVGLAKSVAENLAARNNRSIPYSGDLKEALEEIILLSSKISYCYILAGAEDGLYILEDSAVEMSDKGSPIERIYSGPAMDSLEKGQPFVSEAISDLHGKWVSVLVPMNNSDTGEIIAIFGTDYPAEEWYSMAVKRTLQAAFVVACLLALLYVLHYAIAKHRELVEQKKKLDQSRARLKDSEALLREVFEQAPIGISIIQGEEYLTESIAGFPTVNAEFQRITGRNKEQLNGVRWQDCTHPDDLNADLHLYQKFKEGKIHGYEVNKRYIRPDGETVWIKLILSSLSFGGLPNSHDLCLIMDINSQKQVESALMESERSKAVMLDNLPGMAYRCNYDRQWTMRFVSNGCYALTGYQPEELLNNAKTSFNDLIVPKYRDHLWERYSSTKEKNWKVKEEYEIITAAGRMKWVMDQAQPVYDEHGVLISIDGLIIDITDRKMNEMKLKFISEHDTVTGLNNRRYFEEVLVKGKISIGCESAVLLVNVKNFNLINMTHGYYHSEAVIKRLAAKLRGLCNEDISLFQISIDSFAFLVKHGNNRPFLFDFCQRIFDIAEGTVLGTRIYTNIGIMELDARVSDATGILKCVAIAVDRANQYPGNAYCFYDSDIEKSILRKELIRAELEKVMAGIAGESFYLEYQPIVDVRTGKIYGFEALSRLKSENLGHVSPMEFIRLAEETQLIIPLGKILLRMAMDFLKRLEDEGFAQVSISLNVSGIQLLRDDFLSIVTKAAEESGADLSRFIIEITESVFFNDYQKVNERLEAIRQMGIRTAIDDFGTSYSSLSRVGELSVDYTKIDKYFIDKLMEKGSGRDITADIISMTHKLGQRVVAEGVENEHQSDYLMRNGCDFIQGYFFSRPVSEQKVIEILHDQNNGKYLGEIAGLNDKYNAYYSEK